MDQNNVKQAGAALALPFMASAYTIYFCHRVRKYLRGICPKNKMAMLGKYRRNLLNWSQNSRMVHAWTVFTVISMSTLYSNHNPSVIFWIHHVTYFVLICLIHGLFLPLSMEIPWKCDIKKCRPFYVNRPKVLEPRGCQLPTSFTSTTPSETAEPCGRCDGVYSYLIRPSDHTIRPHPDSDMEFVTDARTLSVLNLPPWGEVNAIMC